MRIGKCPICRAGTLYSICFLTHHGGYSGPQYLSTRKRTSLLFLISFFIFAYPNPLRAETSDDIILDYEGEHIEWNFEVIDTLAAGQSYIINDSLTSLGCVKWDGVLGPEMKCTYAADAPYYGNVYKLNVRFDPSAGTTHSMWTTVKPYPNHDEYDFSVNSQNFYGSGTLSHTATSMFVPMWPEDVNTAYEIVVRYTSDRPEGHVGFNIHILFWGFDPTSIPNLPWLKGEPGDNPYLKFCGGKIRPDRRGGGPGL